MQVSFWTVLLYTIVCPVAWEIKIIIRVLTKLLPLHRTYRKIPKIIPGAYIFQRPFLRGLFSEGLIFGGAYLQREICVSKSIGLALQLEVNLLFLLCFALYLRAIFQVQAPGWLIFGGAIQRRIFLHYPLGGLIHGGAYFQNFTVFCNAVLTSCLLISHTLYNQIFWIVTNNYFFVQF